MNGLVVYVTAFVATVASPLAAQTRSQLAAEPVVKLQPGETAVPGECLTKQELNLISALSALHRPTLGAEGNGDDQAPFNPHYLLGTWAITGLLPDSALGTGGDFIGTETVRHVDGCTYESTIQANLPDRKVTIKALTVYDRRERYMVRVEDDSRGFRLLKVGRVGGDPGGYSSHYWETPPVTRQKSQVRLKGRTLISSPDSFRVQMQISVDGEPFSNYGTLSWDRAEAKKP
jgi:hypothetical protein